MNKFIAVSMLLASLSLCAPALAWNKAGHMVSGQVDQGLQSGSKTDGKVLPDDYANTAKAIAERRMMLAGYWLADYFKAAF